MRMLVAFSRRLIVAQTSSFLRSNMPRDQNKLNDDAVAVISVSSSLPFD